MRHLRWLVPVLGVSSMVVVACGPTDETEPSGDAGAGGEAAGGTPGAGGDAAAGMAGAAGGCAEDGTGTVVLEVTGLPAGVAAEVLLEGPEDLVVEDMLEGVAAGSYVVSAGRVFDADPIVRTVFDATLTETKFCLAGGSSHTVEVAYAAIPSSNKLWMTTDQDDELAGFASEVLTETGSTPSTVAVDGPAGKAVAFDKDGNLWAMGNDPHIMRFPARLLGASGSRVPDIAINVPEVTCLPSMRTMAFDAEGNLWLSVCGDKVLRLPAADLATSGDKVADVLIAGLAENEAHQGLAFDSTGNLWVAGSSALSRYDAARLAESTGDPADLLITLRNLADNADVEADSLAFDKAGNLWATSFKANAVMQLAAADLSGAGQKNVVVSTSLVVGVLGLLNVPAFDEGNGLWLSLNSGRIGRLSPAQLGVSSGPGAPVTPGVVIDSVSIGADLPIAFFPAPEGLPLFHSLP